jgi:protein-S-isoprenylcysteine O-methyltransferase Ste14
VDVKIAISSSLVRRGLISLVALFAVMAVVLFGGAGTLDWWQGWLFLLIYFAWSIGVSVWLARHDPALFVRRMSGGPWAETHPAQKVIMTLMMAGFVALVFVPALDYRFGWSHAPVSLVIAGNALFSLGWLAIVLVFRENSFTATTVAIMPDQAVVTTGPYSIVRHPMYAGALFLLAGMPLALGSWWGLVALAVILPVLVWRLLDEERMLVRDLAGYAAYRQMVRYRLVPGVW